MCGFEPRGNQTRQNEIFEEGAALEDRTREQIYYTLNKWGLSVGLYRTSTQRDRVCYIGVKTRQMGILSLLFVICLSHIYH